MEDQKKQLIQRLKEAKNILVTVSRDPSVDQLAAAIGLTVAFNRLDKHATAVYSGATPSTLQFLKPEDTLEKTTDSLRDFIIALDKSKADKLRYKVEDQVVRIFITPYHTAISEADLDFSQGDFNVDVVVALGVTTQQDIDEAVQAHGRILHDATVAVLSNESQPEIGTLNVVDLTASSLSEIALELIEGMGKKVLDAQIATALLTGIVAMTERFSNDRTTPKTMNASATLMAAGANQQLIATELEAPEIEPEAEEPSDNADQEDGTEATSDAEVSADEPVLQPREPGTLEIMHDEFASIVDDEPAELPSVEEEPESTEPQIHVDENGKLSVIGQDSLDDEDLVSLPEPQELPKIEIKRERMADQPSFDNPLSANTEEEGYSPPAEDLIQPMSATPILSHNEHVLTDAAVPPIVSSEPVEPTAEQPASTSWQPEPTEPDSVPDQSSTKTLAEIEQEVNSPHLHANDGAEPVHEPTHLEGARDAVDAALQAATASAYLPEPITALNAQPLGPELHANDTENESAEATADTLVSAPPVPQFAAPSAPSAFPGAPLPNPSSSGQPAPPPVPPPMIPPMQ